MAQRLTTVLWDLDGTLVNSEPAHDAAFRSALIEIGLTVGPDFHARMLGVSDDGVHAELRAIGLALDLPDWRALKWRYYAEVAKRVQPLPDILGVLQALAAADVPLAVVSNSTRAEVNLLLDLCGLAGFFTTTVSRADVARGKPEPDGYLLAAARMGVPPASCVVIEDSPTGARAGRAAGMVTLFRPQTEALAGSTPEGAIYLAPEGDLLATLADLRIAGLLPFAPAGDSHALLKARQV